MTKNLVVEAALKGEEYFQQRTVKKTDEDGNHVTVTVPKRVNKWFFTNYGNDWDPEVTCGNRTCKLAKGESAIAVGTDDGSDKNWPSRPTCETSA